MAPSLRGFVLERHSRLRLLGNTARFVRYCPCSGQKTATGNPRCRSADAFSVRRRPSTPRDSSKPCIPPESRGGGRSDSTYSSSLAVNCRRTGNRRNRPLGRACRPPSSRPVAIALSTAAASLSRIRIHCAQVQPGRSQIHAPASQVSRRMYQAVFEEYTLCLDYKKRGGCVPRLDRVLLHPCIYAGTSTPDMCSGIRDAKRHFSRRSSKSAQTASK